MDANSFYCSAEKVYRPEWRDKAIIVLSNNDGTVVACDSRAKALQVPKFEPFFKVKSLCDQKGIIALSSNYELYSDLSQKMMAVIGRFSPTQHIYSIDEIFLNLKRCFPAIPCLISHGQSIRKAVWKECRLPVCVGLGPTLTLSKLANQIAKKEQHHNGVFLLDDPLAQRDLLKTYDVSNIWGIGSRTAKQLSFLGINSVTDFIEYPLDRLERNFNIEIVRVARELRGQACKQWDECRADKKQIYSTRSLGERIQDLSLLRQALSKHAAIASKKAREQGSLCKVLVCFASNSSYDEQPVYYKSIHHFAHPTADVTQISAVVSHLASELYKPGVNYYKVGVGLIELVDGRNEQQDLFNPAPNNEKLMGVFDQINTKYGADSVFLGAQGINPKWAMKRQRLTPQYTTNWRHLPTVKC